jgi:hypothetical protein
MKAISFSVISIMLVLSMQHVLAQDAPLDSKARGAVVPKNLQTIVVAQRAASVQVGALLSEVIKPPEPGKGAGGFACTSGQSKFSWQELHKVTSIQDQRSCGDCWSFAAIAAYESSDLIENNRDAPPSTIGASEQQGLDCAWTTYNCKGGWHDKVFDYFVNSSESMRTDYRYTAIKQICRPMKNRPYTALRWDFVDGANIPSIEKLKEAICAHGPIVAAVNATGWDAQKVNPQTGTSYFTYSKANPNWQQEYPDAVFSGGLPSKSDLNANNIQDGDIDHDVLIVGWDDAAGGTGAWIVKNSWGADWGDNGYIRVAYGTANLGFNAAWIQATQSPATANAAQSISERLKNAIQIINRNAMTIQAMHPGDE